MTEPRDMDAPVTRRELHDALGHWSGAIIEKVAAQIRAAIADSEQRVMSVVRDLVQVSEARLTDEIRHRTKGSEEELASRLVAVDEQYKDLPTRVTRLETKVFPPKKPRRRRAG